MPSRLKAKQIIRIKSKFYAENRFHQKYWCNVVRVCESYLSRVVAFWCAKMLLWLYVLVHWILVLWYAFWHKFSVWAIFPEKIFESLFLLKDNPFLCAKRTLMSFNLNRQTFFCSWYSIWFLWVFASLYLLLGDSKRVKRLRRASWNEDTMLHRHIQHSANGKILFHLKVFHFCNDFFCIMLWISWNSMQKLYRKKDWNTKTIIGHWKLFASAKKHRNAPEY